MSASSAPIHGRDGDLVSLRVTTDPRHLEDLLEVLAAATFPVNPQLWHRAGAVIVEFPAWESNLDELKRLLHDSGFDTGLQISAALAGCKSAVSG